MDCNNDLIKAVYLTSARVVLSPEQILDGILFSFLSPKFYFVPTDPSANLISWRNKFEILMDPKWQMKQVLLGAYKEKSLELKYRVEPVCIKDNKSKIILWQTSSGNNIYDKRIEQKLHQIISKTCHACLPLDQKPSFSYADQQIERNLQQDLSNILAASDSLYVVNTNSTTQQREFPTKVTTDSSLRKTNFQEISKLSGADILPPISTEHLSFQSETGITILKKVSNDSPSKKCIPNQGKQQTTTQKERNVSNKDRKTTENKPRKTQEDATSQGARSSFTKPCSLNVDNKTSPVLSTTRHFKQISSKPASTVSSSTKVATHDQIRKTHAGNTHFDLGLNNAPKTVSGFSQPKKQKNSKMKIDLQSKNTAPTSSSFLTGRNYSSLVSQDVQNLFPKQKVYAISPPKNIVKNISLNSTRASIPSDHKSETLSKRKSVVQTTNSFSKDTHCCSEITLRAQEENEYKCTEIFPNQTSNLNWISANRVKVHPFPTPKNVSSNSIGGHDVLFATNSTQKTKSGTILLSNMPKLQQIPITVPANKQTVTDSPNKPSEIKKNICYHRNKIPRQQIPALTTIHEDAREEHEDLNERFHSARKYLMNKFYGKQKNIINSEETSCSIPAKRSVSATAIVDKNSGLPTQQMNNINLVHPRFRLSQRSSEHNSTHDKPQTITNQTENPQRKKLKTVENKSKNSDILKEFIPDQTADLKKAKTNNEVKNLQKSIHRLKKRRKDRLTTFKSASQYNPQVIIRDCLQQQKEKSNEGLQSVRCTDNQTSSCTAPQENTSTPKQLVKKTTKDTSINVNKSTGDDKNSLTFPNTVKHNLSALLEFVKLSELRKRRKMNKLLNKRDQLKLTYEELWNEFDNHDEKNNETDENTSKILSSTNPASGDDSLLVTYSEMSEKLKEETRILTDIYLERLSERLELECLKVRQEMWRQVQMCRVCTHVGLISSCSNCMSVFYCNKKCQFEDWSCIHSEECNRYKERVYVNNKM